MSEEELSEAIKDEQERQKEDSEVRGRGTTTALFGVVLFKYCKRDTSHDQDRERATLQKIRVTQLT